MTPDTSDPDPRPSDDRREPEERPADPYARPDRLDAEPDDGPDDELDVDEPQRRPLNLSGWIALGLAIAAFGASLLIAWPGAILLAAFALALSITGVVRVYRGRATNKGPAVTALCLAIATVILGFVWANRAQVCVPPANDTERFDACYEARTGIL